MLHGGQSANSASDLSRFLRAKKGADGITCAGGAPSAGAPKQTCWPPNARISGGAISWLNGKTRYGAIWSINPVSPTCSLRAANTTSPRTEICTDDQNRYAVLEAGGRSMPKHAPVERVCICVHRQVFVAAVAEYLIGARRRC